MIWRRPGKAERIVRIVEGNDPREGRIKVSYTNDDGFETTKWVPQDQLFPASQPRPVTVLLVITNEDNGMGVGWLKGSFDAAAEVLVFATTRPVTVPKLQQTLDAQYPGKEKRVIQSGPLSQQYYDGDAMPADSGVRNLRMQPFYKWRTWIRADGTVRVSKLDMVDDASGQLTSLIPLNYAETGELAADTDNPLDLVGKDVVELDTTLYSVTLRPVLQPRFIVQVIFTADQQAAAIPEIAAIVISATQEVPRQRDAPTLIISMRPAAAGAPEIRLVAADAWTDDAFIVFMGEQEMSLDDKGTIQKRTLDHANVRGGRVDLARQMWINTGTMDDATLGVDGNKTTVTLQIGNSAPIAMQSPAKGNQISGKMFWARWETQGDDAGGEAPIFVTVIYHKDGKKGPWTPLAVSVSRGGERTTKRVKEEIQLQTDD